MRSTTLSFKKSQFDILTRVGIFPVNGDASGYQFPPLTFTHDLPKAVQVKFPPIILSIRPGHDSAAILSSWKPPTLITRGLIFLLGENSTTGACMSCHATSILR
jgi:hypothetical protein